MRTNMKKKLHFCLFSLFVMSCNSHKTNANNIFSEKEKLPSLDSCQLSIHQANFNCMDVHTHFKEKYKDMNIEEIQKAFIHVPEECGVTENDVFLYTYCAVNNK